MTDIPPSPASKKIEAMKDRDEFDKLTKAGFDHPCKDTCSGWKQGYDRGVFTERARKLDALLPNTDQVKAYCAKHGDDSVIHFLYWLRDFIMKAT